MWGSSSSKLLLLWGRRLKSQFDSHHYHASAALLHPEVRGGGGGGGGGIKPVVKKHKHRLKPTPAAVSEGWQQKQDNNERSPALQRPNQWKKGDKRVSSELRKLRVEDVSPPAAGERERRTQRSMVFDSRAEKDHEIVFGVAPCLLALTQGRRKAQKLFVKDGEASHRARASVLKVCEEARRREVQVQRVSKRDLDSMCAGRVHQGVCLQASPLGFLTEDREDAAGPGGQKEKDATSTSPPPLWLVLAGIQDPMNLGAILRSAYFLGVDRVASSLRDSCPLTPVVSKASSGAMEVLGVYGYENLEDMLRLKASRGWEVVGTVGAVDESHPLPPPHSPLPPVTQCSDFHMTKPTLLLMGGEGGGLSRELLSSCQTLLTIPAGRDLFPGIESLNVSVAAAILLHSLLSSRLRGSSGSQHAQITGAEASAGARRYIKKRVK